MTLIIIEWRLYQPKGTLWTTEFLGNAIWEMIYLGLPLLSKSPCPISPPSLKIFQKNESPNLGEQSVKASGI